MSYDGALVMPSSYAVMSEDEMCYIEGGDAHLPMKTAYLNKAKCKEVAASLIKNKKVKNMSELGIAQEIFGHAILFYRAALVNYAGINSWVINEIISHAKVADIENGGDKWYKVVAYSALWYGNPSFS